MSSDALLYVMSGAVVVSAMAMIWQGLLLMGMYRASKEIRVQVSRIADHTESFTQSAQRSLEQGRRQIAEVASKTGEILDLAHKQFVRIDDVLGDATSRARNQMDRVDMIMDDTLSRLHETSVLLNKGILRPVREVNAVAAGIQAALGYLFRSQRLTVERATHDEEMFI